jgi:TRAP-type C4-dicarboxylate transport system permease small subunit
MPPTRTSLWERLIDWPTLLSGWALLALSVMIAFEVLARKYFQLSLKGVDEFGGYVLAIGSAIGFSYALIMRGHVRVDLLLLKVSTPLQDWANWIAALAMTAFSYVLLWRTLFVYARTWQLGAKSGTPLDTPLVYPQGLWTIALVLFAVVCTATLWRLSAVCFFGSDQRDDLLAMRDEEVEMEAAEARRRLAGEGVEGPSTETGNKS